MSGGSRNTKYDSQMMDSIFKVQKLENLGQAHRAMYFKPVRH